MAVTYSLSTKNARMTAVRDQIDAGAGAGKIEICTAGMATVLAVFTLNDPCGTIADGKLTLTGFPKSDSSADATGVAAAARIRDSNNNDVVTGLTVGTSNADVLLDNTSINITQQVTLQSAVITHAT